ncbi:MAG: R3H domain-containing nucleic acid-binding protein [Prochlorotrichaceae cyanobacterium]
MNPTEYSEKRVVDDLGQLIVTLPQSLAHTLIQHPHKDQLVEVVMDLGRLPEARFPTGSEYIGTDVITPEDLQYCIERVGIFGGDNRAGIERTLHRISGIRNRSGTIIGLTCRVGRSVFGTIALIDDLVATGKSILMLGRPGVGKTTALREIARVLADDFHKRVVIIDTSNEIAGDGDIPHPAIGRARRMQVARPELQHQVMIEAVENHMPEVIVIDEIGTELEALAARTIAERGVQLVGTAHGTQIENLIKNPTLADLIGGIQAVTLGDDEARRRGSQKTVLERKASPTFEIAVEMQERHRWVVHVSVADTVDQLLRHRPTSPQVRSVNEVGQVVVTQQIPEVPLEKNSRGGESGWRTSGQMRPIPFPWSGHSNGRSNGRSIPEEAPRPTSPPSAIDLSGSEETTYSDRLSGESDLPSPLLEPSDEFESLLNAALETVAPDPSRWSTAGLWTDERIDGVGLNGEDLPLHIYPYAVSRHQLEQVIQTLQLPVVLTKEIDQADAVLALRAHLKNHSKLRQMSRNHQIPIHAIKSNTLPHIVRALKRLLNHEEAGLPEEEENRVLRGSHHDELEALEEARLAVEQLVLPQGKPVELLPRPAHIRKMQHELVEHYRLKSASFGEEPNRRLRIYPA